jgi:regulator of ribonuclease activity A
VSGRARGGQLEIRHISFEVEIIRDMASNETLTADLCDAHAVKLDTGELQVLASLFPLRLGQARTMAGPVATLKVFEDNALVRQMLQTPGQGRVLLIDGGGSTRRALVGGNLGKLAQDNGWSGIVVFGAVRDCDELDRCSIAIRAVASCPRPTVKAGEGKIDVALEIAGSLIKPGMWLYEDRDGILIAAGKL